MTDGVWLQEFRAALPADQQYLLDWDSPEDKGRDKSGSWGMAANKLSSLEQLQADEAAAKVAAAQVRFAHFGPTLGLVCCT